MQRMARRLQVDLSAEAHGLQALMIASSEGSTNSLAVSTKPLLLGSMPAILTATA